VIRFTLGAPETVTLTVYDVSGRELATLLRDEHLPSGPHQVPFRGTGLRSGVYLYRLRAGHNVETKKMIVLQ